VAHDEWKACTVDESDTRLPSRQSVAETDSMRSMVVRPNLGRIAGWTALETTDMLAVYTCSDCRSVTFNDHGHWVYYVSYSSGSHI
jgi:hypothetical protein